MTSLAAAALAAAVLSLPSSPRRRLVRERRGRAPISRRAAPGFLACIAVAAGVVLPLTTSLALLVCLATAAVRYSAARRTARGARQAGELQTAITVLTGELRVGAHPAAAFAAAAEETDGSVAVACRAVAARARLGGDVVAGLRGASQVSVLSHQWDRLAVCWQLATEHGLAMAALMESAQRDIAERQRFCNHVRSAMAGARATATILAALPVLSVVMGQLIGARTLALLLGGHWGGWLLVGGTTLICGGLLWSDRITGNAATS